MAIDPSCIMGRNCGTRYQVTLNAPLLYMNFLENSMNGASPCQQTILNYFRCLILDCLWNVLEVFKSNMVLIFYDILIHIWSQMYI